MASIKANKTYYRTSEGTVMAEDDPAFDHGQLLVREGAELEEGGLAGFPDPDDLMKQIKSLNTESKAEPKGEDKAVKGPAENKAAKD